MEHEESQPSDSRQALAREDSSHCVGCDDKRSRGKRNVQCIDERVTDDHPRPGEECAVAMVLSRKSTIWRRAIVKTLLRKRQMKYIDVEEMRVVTNDKHIAEQIKSDSTLPARECLLNRTVESTVMDGVKSKRRDFVMNIVMDGPKVGKIGKVEKEQKYEERRKFGK